MQYIAFMLGANEFAVPITKVQEIIKEPKLTGIPQSEQFIEGVANLRGKIIPIMNLKLFLSIYDETPKEDRKVVVLSHGKNTLGVIIDSVTGVLNVDDSDVDSLSATTSLRSTENILGVAKNGDRMTVLLKVQSIMKVSDEEIDSNVLEVQQNGDTVTVAREIDSMGGKMIVKETINAEDYFKNKGIEKDDARSMIVEEMMVFMKALNEGRVDDAEKAMQSIVGHGQTSIFSEVGKVTRKLHDSIRTFKEALDPKLKDMTIADMPSAIDRLQFVIDKTEEAANKTMSVVEKNIMLMDDVNNDIRGISDDGDNPLLKANLKHYVKELENDFTEILTAQSFQDITGQTIKKVISLVGDIEGELVKLITTFGVSISDATGKQVDTEKIEKVTQENVDDMLKEFGF